MTCSGLPMHRQGPYMLRTLLYAAGSSSIATQSFALPIDVRASNSMTAAEGSSSLNDLCLSSNGRSLAHIKARHDSGRRGCAMNVETSYYAALPYQRRSSSKGVC